MRGCDRASRTAWPWSRLAAARRAPSMLRAEFDPALMKEIGITHEKLLTSLKERINGLKHVYHERLAWLRHASC